MSKIMNQAISVTNGNRGNTPEEDLLEALKVLPVAEEKNLWLVGKIPYLKNLGNDFLVITSKNSQTVNGKAYRAGLLAQIDWACDESPCFSSEMYFIYREDQAIQVGSVPHRCTLLPRQHGCGLSLVDFINEETGKLKFPGSGTGSYWEDRFREGLGLSKNDLEAWKEVDIRSTFDWDSGIMTFGEYKKA